MKTAVLKLYSSTLLQKRTVMLKEKVSNYIDYKHLEYVYNHNVPKYQTNAVVPNLKNYFFVVCFSPSILSR